MGVIIQSAVGHKILRPIVKELALNDLPPKYYFFYPFKKTSVFFGHNSNTISLRANLFTIGHGVLWPMSECITTPRIQKFEN